MKIVHNIDKKGRKHGCPAGANCDTCNLYQPAYKSDANGNVVEQVMDCTIKHIAMQLFELKGRNIGVQAAVENLHNTVAGVRPQEPKHASLPR